MVESDQDEGETFCKAVDEVLAGDMNREVKNHVMAAMGMLLIRKVEMIHYPNRKLICKQPLHAYDSLKTHHCNCADRHICSQLAHCAPAPPGCC